ncbi:NAD(P)/FAD-dependent oxidoreductase [Sphingomonas sp. PAMC 26617]|uniref:NAD(P)/FAD-dependent oxidoreductase n=1 Tax=Sphingomonas sp. PAMC 26617 TaxID=1112216 RepID=UPI0002897864|nr:FAD-binding oxidoreductase [Sphingomonas sp. PAMC 26617]
MTTTADAIVIGGGLHGLSAALQLARRQVKVVLLERSRVGRHSSGASAAGVRTLNRARAELKLAIVAMDMWHHMEELVGDNCGFRPYGQLQLAENDEELQILKARVDGLNRDGFTNEEIVSADEVRSLVPALAPVYIAAALARNDGAADPHQTLMAFRRAAVEAGVTILEGVGVRSLHREGHVWRASDGSETFEAPLLVNAAGAWAGQIAAWAGDDIPIATKASMMIVTERVAPFIRPTVISMKRKLSFKQSNQGTLLIGGGQQGLPDLEAERSEVDARLLAKSAAAAISLFPAVKDLRIVRSWAGLEAKTRDDIAIAGLSPSAPSLMHLFGFSGHGFQLVPALGVATAELLLDGRSTVDLSGLQPGRLMAGAKPDKRKVDEHQGVSE